jgi:hypothetical protein
METGLLIPSGKCDQTGAGWPANMAGAGGAWATQRAEWIALMAKNEFPGADPTNLNGLGAPERNIPTNVVANPGLPVEAANAKTPLVVTKNPDGSTKSANGKISNTSVVFNSPA